mgnify:CR=1 FL=1
MLNFGNTGTIPGDAFVYNACPWVAPGMAGANQTWDLSALTSDSLIMIQFVDPATPPDGASFPSATIAAEDMGFFAYSQFDATGGFFHGMTSQPGDPPIVYSDPMQMAFYPATFGTTWTDDFHAEFLVSGFNIVRDGTLSAECDGYGTLILPWGTLTDVLRCTYVEDYTENSGFTTVFLHREYTHFLQAGTHYPIVHLFSFTTTVFGSVNTISGSQWLVDGSVGMPATAYNQPSINAWADASSNAIQIDLDLGTQTGSASLDLLDASGALLVQRQLGATSGRQRERISTGSLAAGMYLVRVHSGGATASQRVVVP